MAKHTISRRHFFFGSLLAGAIPRAGFGSVPSLKALGYQSPNEKLNIAGIGAGGQPFSDLRGCETENIVALADVDWVRGGREFERYDKAAKSKDFRQMLDKYGKTIDAVLIASPDHMHTYAALYCMERGKGVYVEKPLTRMASEARAARAAAQKYKVATQMGNQGYSHEATRVACEIIWSGEIGDCHRGALVESRPCWPQAMKTTPAPTPVPSTLDWDLWLGVAAARPFTAGDKAYQEFVASRSRRAGGARAEPPRRLAGGAPAGAGMGDDDFGYLHAVQLARVLRLRLQPDRRLGRASTRAGQLGAVPQPRDSGERRVHQEGRAAADHVPGLLYHQVRVQGAQRHAAGHGLLVSGPGW